MNCPFHQFQHIREFDPLDAGARENPWPYYDWLRNNNQAVYKVPHETGFYMVHRFEDVKNIFSDAENFSNKILPTLKSPFLALMDGADHQRIREIAGRIFTQKNILKWEPEIRNAILESTENLIQNKPVELFEAWANVIPLRTLSEIFGLATTPAAITKLHEDAIAINKALFVTGGTGPRRSGNPGIAQKFLISWALVKNSGKILRLRRLLGKKGMKELRDMISPERNNVVIPRPNFEHIPVAITPMLDLMLAFAEGSGKSGAKKNSSISILNDAVEAGEITKVEMIMTGAFILFAGYETTTSLLSNCFVHLARHPQLFSTLKQHPEKIEDFIEESLRYYTPVGRFLRRANKDVEISGSVIPKDSLIILMTGAANTDPVKFENGCAFDMDRANNRQHLSFGKGTHFCIGAPLARIQVTLALKELIQRAVAINIDESSPLKMVTDRDNGILRFEKLIVTVK